MSFCRIHGRYSNSGNGCPDCREVERESGDLNRSILGALERGIEDQAEAERSLADERRQSDYKRANPGDFKCPECKYVTLLIEASRCPMCHASIPAAFWPPKIEQLKLEAERKAERLRREAEEDRKRREIQSREASERALQDELDSNRRKRAKQLLRFCTWYFLYILPVLVVNSAGISSGHPRLADFWPATLVPIWNLATCIYWLFVPNSGPMMATWLSFAFWMSVGMGWIVLSGRSK